jgi:RNA polymerase sigma factor (sigma-70 family)
MSEVTASAASLEVLLDFPQFFEAEYGRLARACVLLTGQRALAEDIAQEAMSRAYERWARVQTMESPTGYVYRIALNLHRRHARRASVGPLHRPAVHEELGGDPASEVETRSEIFRALGILSIEQRQAVVLMEWLGYTAEEAGALLQIDAASVRGRVHRARALLRERFGVPDA